MKRAYNIQYILYVRVNFAITNNLGDVLFRSFVWTFAQCTGKIISIFPFSIKVSKPLVLDF